MVQGWERDSPIRGAIRSWPADAAALLSSTAPWLGLGELVSNLRRERI